MRRFALFDATAFKVLTAALVAACLFAATPAEAHRRIVHHPPAPGPDFIDLIGTLAFDGGGAVADYSDEVASANAAGERVEISGTCASACTMKLGAHRACVYRDAQLLFHAAHFDDGGKSSLGTRIMLRQYPAGIRAWAMRSGALNSEDFTAMSGAQAISLGVPDCARPASAALPASRTVHFSQTRLAGRRNDDAQ